MIVTLFLPPFLDGGLSFRILGPLVLVLLEGKSNSFVLEDDSFRASRRSHSRTGWL